MPNGAQTRLVIILGALALAVAAVLYWPVTGLDYVWDDNILFVDNPALRTGAIDWSKLSRPILIGTSYFRPVVIWSFMAEFRYLGLSAMLSHAINYSIYLCNVLLVLVLAWSHCRRLDMSHPAIRSAVAGLVYAVHPALVESTTWVSGRFDLLATFFVLLALVADLRITSSWRRASVVGMAFGLGLGSKEVAVVLPILLVLQRLAVEQTDTPVHLKIAQLLRNHLRTVLTCGFVGLAYVLLRLDAVGGFVPRSSGPDGALKGFGAQLAFTLQALFFYVEQCFMPFVGSSMPAHPANVGRVFYPLEMARAVGAIVVLMLVTLAVRKRAYGGYLLSGALVCLAPVIHIVSLPIANNIGCDRFLTLPLVFAVLALASLNISAPFIRPAVVKLSTGLIVGTWVAMAVANVHATIPLWTDNLTLWGWIYREGIESPNARVNYTSAALRVGRYDLAKEVFDEKLKDGPLEANEQMNYGFLLAKTGDPGEGMRYIEGALFSYPRIRYADQIQGHPVSIRDQYLRGRIAFGYYALAEAKLILRDAEGALKSIEEARRYEPFSPYIMLSYSLVLSALGRDVESESEFQKVLSLSHPVVKDGYTKRRQNFLKQWAASKDKAETGDSQ